MGNENLLKALGRLVVETGSLACLDCGWEQDCGVHGCAILRGVKAKLEEESARADEAEAALAAAVRDMEAMALTIRRRGDHDTECCSFCHYDGPEEDYCPGWEENGGETCFRWRGADRSRKPTGDLSRDSTKMVPLTLKQLREMDGHPVWIAESPDWGHWELSEDAGDYICDRDTDLYGLTYPDQDGRGGLHKLGWVAYAYPPSRIDREAWEPCRVCRQYEVLGFRGWRRQENMLKPPDGSGGCMYCPHCGRPRNEKAWAQLEQRLRGEQVDEQERGQSEAGDT